MPMKDFKPVILWMSFLGLLIGYVYATPYITLLMIKRSIDSKSAQEVERFIDFADVRDSLKSQLANHLQDEASKDNESPQFSQLSAGIGTALGGTIIDTLVQPRNLQKWLNGDKISDLEDTQPFPTSTGVFTSESPASFGYTSFETFEVRPSNSQVVSAVVLERRNIFNWKVISVILDKSLFVNTMKNEAPSSQPQNQSISSRYSNESKNLEVDYVNDGPGGHFYVLKNGLLYYSDEYGDSSEPEGRPEKISQNILRIDDFYYCRWEGYADLQVAQIGGSGSPWICTVNGIRPK
jgi:hypothetical protein